MKGFEIRFTVGTARNIIMAYWHPASRIGKQLVTGNPMHTASGYYGLDNEVDLLLLTRLCGNRSRHQVAAALGEIRAFTWTLS